MYFCVFPPQGGGCRGLHQQRGLTDATASGPSEAHHHFCPYRLVRGCRGQQWRGGEGKNRFMRLDCLPSSDTTLNEESASCSHLFFFFLLRSSKSTTASTWWLPWEERHRRRSDSCIWRERWGWKRAKTVGYERLTWLLVNTRRAFISMLNIWFLTSAPPSPHMSRKTAEQKVRLSDLWWVYFFSLCRWRSTVSCSLTCC